MNVGANSITDTGLYFSYGDTQGYTAEQVTGGQHGFGWGDDGDYSDYKFAPNGFDWSDPNYGLTKYNNTDSKTVLETSDDAVQANWGGSWRMPTTTEFQALGTATTSAWTSSYEGSGVAGLVLTSKADSSKKLFFPAAGYCDNGSVDDVGSGGDYWSSSLDNGGVEIANDLYFNSSNVDWHSHDNRYVGFSVRGVWDGEGTPTILEYVQVTPEQNKLYIDTTTNKIYRYNGISYVETPDLNGKESTLSLQTISSGTYLAAELNKYYAFTTSLNTFTITLPSMAGVTNATGFMVSFTTGSTPNFIVSSINSVKYHEGYSIEANKTYELSFLWNGTKWLIGYGIFE